MFQVLWILCTPAAYILVGERQTINKRVKHIVRLMVIVLSGKINPRRASCSGMGPGLNC